MPGPYPQATAVLGGIPTVDVDVPICSVFLLLFALGFAGHMTLFRRNLARGHKFFPSAATSAFCMTRIVANSLRISWATHPEHTPLVVAAQIFVSAGVVILFVLNLLYSIRILRAARPRVGWSRPVSIGTRVLYVLIVLVLVIVITASVQSFFTLDTHTKIIDADLLRFGSSLFAAVASLPLFIIAYVLLSPPQWGAGDFGHGNNSVRMTVVTLAAFLLSFGAWWRAAVNYQASRPVTDPAWYHSKPCFYVVDFAVEICVAYLYLLMRVDRRFHVPDGSSKRRHYRTSVEDSDGTLAGEHSERSASAETLGTLRDPEAYLIGNYSHGVKLGK